MRHEERYNVMDLIGKGAMGEVWLAEDNLLKRRVALKFLTLSPTLADAEQAESVARFHREAQAAGRLAHHNIVTVYDIGEIGGRHFISMEYLEGATLDQVIAPGPQSVEQAAEMSAQVAEALAYAHSQGVVHRDVKPENIFLLPDGTVKVTDFGIARVMGSSTMTQVGTVMGTPGYMSPEQVRGEHTDWRTDIFSAGVVLYELLTGTKAFEAESLTSVMYKVVHEPPPPLASLRPDLDPWVVGVVERACAKDPSSRYQQASQLAQDLRSRSLSAAAPAAPSTILVPGAVPTVAPRQETVLRDPGQAPPPPPEQAGAPSRRRFSAPVLAAIIAGSVLLVAGAVVTLILLLSSSKVTVPDLEGVSYDKARSQLEKLGLVVDKSEMVSDKYEDGEVFSQSPGAGQKVEAGSTVKLDVAKASGSTDTPTGTNVSNPSMVMEEVKASLTGWQLAWENRDINSFLAYYSPDFYCAYQPKMANYSLLTGYKAQLFQSYGWIQVYISELSVTPIDDNNASATFKQQFTCSDSRANDYGQKTLRWKKVNEQWLIYNEEWYAL